MRRRRWRAAPIYGNAICTHGTPTVACCTPVHTRLKRVSTSVQRATVVNREQGGRHDRCRRVGCDLPDDGLPSTGIAPLNRRIMPINTLRASPGTLARPVPASVVPDPPREEMPIHHKHSCTPPITNLRSCGGRISTRPASLIPPTRGVYACRLPRISDPVEVPTRCCRPDVASMCGCASRAHTTSADCADHVPTQLASAMRPRLGTKVKGTTALVVLSYSRLRPRDNCSQDDQTTRD